VPSPGRYAEFAGKAVLARPQEASRRSLRSSYLANRKAVDGICCSRELAELLKVAHADETGDGIQEETLSHWVNSLLRLIWQRHTARSTDWRKGKVR
jgi:hypothetical protein